MNSSLTAKVCGLLVILAAAQACGKKDKKNDPAPITPDVMITDQKQSGDTVTVDFDSTQENAKFDCKVVRGTAEDEWKDCSLGKTFAFKTDANVKTTFYVRARNGDLTSQPIDLAFEASQDQTAGFKVSINEKSNIQSAVKGYGQYEISFNAEGTDSRNIQFMCKVGDKDYQVCTSPFTFSADRNGNAPVVYVYAVDLDTNTNSVEDYIDTNAAATMNRAYDSAQPQLGDFYSVRIPARANARDLQFYISEYATSKTDNTELDMWRIMPGYDQRYIGNTKCAMEHQEVVNALTPSGRKIVYCNGTPAGDVYKFMTRYRWARNHIELITEPEVTNQTGERTIVMMNAFDGERDLMQKRTRFDRECFNSISGVQYNGFVKVFDDYWGREVFAAIYSCQSQRSTRDAGVDGTFGPNLGGKMDTWTVSAAFIIRSTEAYLPRHQNQCVPVQGGTIPCWNEIMPRADHILEVLVKSNQRGSLYLSTGRARSIINNLVVPIR